MTNLHQHFINSMQQSVTVILSAFAGGFAGNFLANNPGLFEQSGATIGLLVLLLPTTFLINLMLESTSNEDDDEVETMIVSNDHQNIKVIHGNGEIVQAEFVEVSTSKSSSPTDEIDEVIEQATR